MPYQEPKAFTVVDPRTFDGDPFDVAERAVKQLTALVELTQEQTKLAALMVLNAEMERQKEPDAKKAEKNIQVRFLGDLNGVLERALTKLGPLAKAASYNPAKPPKA